MVKGLQWIIPYPFFNICLSPPPSPPPHTHTYTLSFNQKLKQPLLSIAIGDNISEEKMRQFTYTPVCRTRSDSSNIIPTINNTDDALLKTVFKANKSSCYNHITFTICSGRAVFNISNDHCGKSFVLACLQGYFKKHQKCSHTSNYD